jgi:hypothetical protein
VVCQLTKTIRSETAVTPCVGTESSHRIIRPDVGLCDAIDRLRATTKLQIPIPLSLIQGYFSRDVRNITFRD